MAHPVVAPDAGTPHRATLSQEERDALLLPFYETYFRVAAAVYRRAEAEGRLDELLAGTYKIDRYPGKTKKSAPTLSPVSALQDRPIQGHTKGPR